MIEKLQKLLAHERSAREIGNQAEAEAFAAKIQQLLFAHKLSMSDIEIEQEECDEPVEQEYLMAKPWAGVLAMACAGSAFCRVLKSGNRLCFIGRTGNRASCVAMFQYLANLGNSIADKECKAWKATDDYAYKVSIRPGIARTWKRSFLHGYAQAIYLRLEGERKALTVEAQSAGTSLVYVNRENAALDTFMSRQFPHLRAGRRSTVHVDRSAYDKGHSYGSSVSLKGRAALC